MSGQGEAINMTMQHNEGDHDHQQQQRQHIPTPHPSPHHSRPSTPMPTNQQELEAYVQITGQRMNEMRAQAHQQLQQLQHTEQRLHQAQQQMSINRLMQVNVEAPSEHWCSTSSINSIIMRSTNRSTFLHKVWCVLVEV